LLVSNDFPKARRFTIASKIENYFLELLEIIFVSLYSPPEHKILKLIVATAKLDGIKFFLQIAWEHKCVSNEKYLELSEKLREVGRMIGGWRKGLEKKTPAKREKTM